MVAVIQPSFSAGEVSDRVQARVDLTKRTVAVASGLNGVVSVTGSLDKRPGTEYIDEVYGNGAARLIPFKFNRAQTYVLVFADSWLEIYRDGTQVESIASPYPIADVWDLRYAQYGDQLTIVHPDYEPRELLRSSDTSWSFGTITFEPEQTFPTEVRAVENKKTDAHTLSFVNRSATPTATATAAHGFSDNTLISFTNSLDMLELERGTFKVEVDSTTEFGLLDPEDGSDYSTSGYTLWVGNKDIYESPRSRNYMVTAVNGQTGEESIAGTGNVSDALSGVDTSTPAVVTTSRGHGLLTGDMVTFKTTGSILDGERFIITRIDNLSFTLQWLNGEDVDGADVNDTGGSVVRCFAQAERSLDDKWDNDVRWDPAADAIIYNIYATDGRGAFGLVGSTTGTSFRDYYITPDTSVAPPQAQNPFFDPSGGTDRYPSTVAYHDQRRVFGNSNDYPNRFWMTQAGNFYNLTWSTPTKEDDAIVATIASSEINDIEHLVSLQQLIAMTGGAEFMLDGGGDPLTPSTITVTPQSFYGAGGLPPLLAGNVGMLHLRGNVIRDFEYSISSQSFVGVDLTILARHLLDPDKYVLEDWTYAHTPSSLLLVVRDDGIAPAFTYFPEQEVFGWTRWITEGNFISVCSIPEDGVDRIYAVIKRVINGTTTYCLERFALPSDDPYAYHGVDCGVHWKQTAKTITDADVDVSGEVVITAAAHGYSNGDTVDISGIYEVGDDNVSVLSIDWNGDGFEVADATANTFKIKYSGSYIDGSAFASYSSRGEVREAVTTVGGLSHLNGETVVAAANGQEVTGLTVAAGSITLTNAASEVHVGLPFTYEVETLPVSAYGTGGTIEGVMKNVNRFALHVISAADFEAGPERDGMVTHERPTHVAPKRQTMMDKSQLVTSRGTWDRNRSMLLQQRSPLPMSIASIIPDALLGEQ